MSDLCQRSNLFIPVGRNGPVRDTIKNMAPPLPEVSVFEDSNDVNATVTSEESHHSAFQLTPPLQSTPAPP